MNCVPQHSEQNAAVGYCISGFVILQMSKSSLNFHHEELHYEFGILRALLAPLLMNPCFGGSSGASVASNLYYCDKVEKWDKPVCTLLTVVMMEVDSAAQSLEMDVVRHWKVYE